MYPCAFASLPLALLQHKKIIKINNNKRKGTPAARRIFLRKLASR